MDAGEDDDDYYDENGEIVEDDPDGVKAFSASLKSNDESGDEAYLFRKKDSIGEFEDYDS